MSALSVALLSLVAATAALPHPGAIIDSHNINDEFETNALFTSFKKEYNRHYSGPLEHGVRYSIFRDNINKINKLNSKHSKAHFKINKFADMTQEEIAKKHYGFKPTQKGSKAYQQILKTPIVSVKNTTAPTAADWRIQGAVTPVKDQGQCGSCWAFSTVETIESAVFLTTGKLPILSEQQVTSCDTVNFGCDGGWPHDAYLYVAANNLETEKSYPYKSGTSGATGTCTYNKKLATQSISGYTYAIPSCVDDPDCTNQDETTMANAISQYGPASICLNADGFTFYDSGILSATECGESSYNYIDHCVQMVGFDLTDTSNKYWIARNSWGATWGESGYIRMEFGTNTCGLANEVTFVQI